MNFLDSFYPSHWIVTAFYPYTSNVTDRLVSQNHNYKTKEHETLNSLWEYFSKEAKNKGCCLGNKIVLQITKKNNSTNSTNAILYIGKYDGIVNIGLSMSQDNCSKSASKTFEL